MILLPFYKFITFDLKLEGDLFVHQNFITSSYPQPLCQKQSN